MVHSLESRKNEKIRSRKSCFTLHSFELKHVAPKETFQSHRKWNFSKTAFLLLSVDVGRRRRTKGWEVLHFSAVDWENFLAKLSEKFSTRVAFFLLLLANSSTSKCKIILHSAKKLAKLFFLPVFFDQLDVKGGIFEIFSGGRIFFRNEMEKDCRGQSLQQQP